MQHRMNGLGAAVAVVISFASFLTFSTDSRAATNYVVVGWNDMGIHRMDSDYSVFAIAPPANTLHAQIIQNFNNSQTRLLTNSTGFTCTFEGVADTNSSINTTSQGKVNFWENAFALYGVSPAADTGLTGTAMPGLANTRQPLAFTTDYSWFTAADIPITPYDNAGMFNPYPLLQLAVQKSGTTTNRLDVVAPVSDEMDCQLCHLSGGSAGARSTKGWVFDPNPKRDVRLNILRLHDDRQLGNPTYQGALVTAGYNTNGLYATVTITGKPILCVKCHPSLGAAGIGGVIPLTQAIHGLHAAVTDPRTAQALDDATDRSACYTCHPGTNTQFLRGVMGSAVATNGTMLIHCQDCHGNLSTIADPTRTAWLDEPDCQSCHVGDVINNVGGQIRYDSVFTNGVVRTTTNQRFATDPNVPSAPYSLYRYSRGHGNLACSACHGSPHAEFPSAVANDNVQVNQHQKTAGWLTDCDVCHGTQSLTWNGGPHGMHPHNDAWATGGHFSPGGTVANCTPCHGTGTSRSNIRGSVLSRALRAHTINAGTFGTKNFWKGQTIGCTECHSRQTATTANASAATNAGVPVTMTLTATSATPTNNLRVVSQPAHGTVAMNSSAKQATYYPDTGFVGTDKFTFATFNGRNDSNLSTGTVTVAEIFTVADGVPDWWRSVNFGGNGQTTNGQSCATCDPDGDGQGNYAEYKASTNPLDSRSAVRMIPVQVVSNDVRVGFASEVVEKYDVQRSLNLLTGPWTTIVSNVWGKTDTTTVLDPGQASKTQIFYRVRVVP